MAEREREYRTTGKLVYRMWLEVSNDADGEEMGEGGGGSRVDFITSLLHLSFQYQTSGCGECAMII